MSNSNPKKRVPTRKKEYYGKLTVTILEGSECSNDTGDEAFFVLTTTCDMPVEQKTTCKGNKKILYWNETFEFDITAPEFVLTVAFWRIRKKKRQKLKKEHTFLQPSLEQWIEDGWLECDTPKPSKPRKSVHLSIQYMPSKIFGVSLMAQYQRHHTMPTILTDIVHFIYSKTPTLADLFRSSLRPTDVQLLHSWIQAYERNRHEEVDLSACIISGTVRVLLIKFIRELPDSLIPKSTFTDWMNAYDIVDEQERRERMRDLIEKMPKCNKLCLCMLVACLRNLQDNSLGQSADRFPPTRTTQSTTIPTSPAGKLSSIPAYATVRESRTISLVRPNPSHTVSFSPTFIQISSSPTPLRQTSTGLTFHTTNSTNNTNTNNGYKDERDLTVPYVPWGFYFGSCFLAPPDFKDQKNLKKVQQVIQYLFDNSVHIIPKRYWNVDGTLSADVDEEESLNGYHYPMHPTRLLTSPPLHPFFMSLIQSNSSNNVLASNNDVSAESGSPSDTDTTEGSLLSPRFVGEDDQGDVFGDEEKTGEGGKKSRKFGFAIPKKGKAKKPSNSDGEVSTKRRSLKEMRFSGGPPELIGGASEELPSSQSLGASIRPTASLDDSVVTNKSFRRKSADRLKKVVVNNNSAPSLASSLPGIVSSPRNSTSPISSPVTSPRSPPISPPSSPRFSPIKRKTIRSVDATYLHSPRGLGSSSFIPTAEQDDRMTHSAELEPTLVGSRKRGGTDSLVSSVQVQFLDLSKLKLRGDRSGGPPALLSGHRTPRGEAPSIEEQIKKTPTATDTYNTTTTTSTTTTTTTTTTTETTPSETVHKESNTPPVPENAEQILRSPLCLSAPVTGSEQRPEGRPILTSSISVPNLPKIDLSKATEAADYRHSVSAPLTPTGTSSRSSTIYQQMPKRPALPPPRHPRPVRPIMPAPNRRKGSGPAEAGNFPEAQTSVSGWNPNRRSSTSSKGRVPISLSDNTPVLRPRPASAEVRGSTTKGRPKSPITMAGAEKRSDGAVDANTVEKRTDGEEEGKGKEAVAVAPASPKAMQELKQEETTTESSIKRHRNTGRPLPMPPSRKGSESQKPLPASVSETEAPSLIVTQSPSDQASDTETVPPAPPYPPLISPRISIVSPRAEHVRQRNLRRTANSSDEKDEKPAVVEEKKEDTIPPPMTSEFFALLEYFERLVGREVVKAEEERRIVRESKERARQSKRRETQTKKEKEERHKGKRSDSQSSGKVVEQTQEKGDM